VSERNTFAGCDTHRRAYVIGHWKWSGTEIKIDGEDFVVMKESDIIGVVEETASRKVA
jgi:hypothetical protein